MELWQVEINVGEQLIRAHPVRHHRTREHGVLANPGGRPHRTNAHEPTPEWITTTGARTSHGYWDLTTSLPTQEQRQ